MNLYFSPLACSMATRIALYEAGVEAEYTCVLPDAKRTLDGADYWAIAPLGQVPALRTDDGLLLTENTAVLQYVADRFPQARLAPVEGNARAQLQQWLGFIGTELHKALFVPLLDRKAPEEVKAYARDKAKLRLGFLETHLAGRDYLLDEFSVADAYLATVLNWATYSGIDLEGWPSVQAYYQRMAKRPAMARALAEELELYRQEQVRKQAA